MGSKGQSKSATAKTPVKARADVEKKVAEKLAEGYTPVPEGPEVARLGKRPSFKLSRGTKAGVDLLGAPGKQGTGPACATCQRPMSLLLRLARHPERLPLTRHAGLVAWVCDGGASCRPWVPDGGASAVELVDAARLEAPAEADAVQALFGPATLEAMPTDDDEEESDGDAKVGGFPRWIQGDARPQCQTCSDQMVLAAQLDGEVSAHNFGDSGRGYVFVCPRECSAVFLSQSC